MPAGTVSADVVLAGTDTVAIGPADLDLAEGTNTIVYAWGSADAGYQLAVQTISGAHSAPVRRPGRLRRPGRRRHARRRSQRCRWSVSWSPAPAPCRLARSRG